MSVEALEERLEGLLARIDGEAEACDGLAAQASSAYAEGARSADELSSKHAEAVARLAHMRRAAKALEEEIETERLASAREEAAAAIASMKKSVGGVAGEHERHAGRALAAIEALAPTIEKVLAGRARQEYCLAAMRLLAERYELPVPDVRMLPPTNGDPLVLEVIERVGALTDVDVRTPIPPVRARSLADRATEIDRTLRERFGMESRVREIVGRGASAELRNDRPRGAAGR